MNRTLRLSAVNLGFGYVLFGIVALVCFAAPLWFAWQVTIRDGRAEIMQEDATRLAREFDRDGPLGLAAYIKSRVGLQIAHERMLLFIDPAGRRLAGNLSQWPADMPARPGTYTVTVPLHGQPSRAVCAYVALPGGYKVLVGRDLAKFAPLETRFWYGLSGAIAILTIAGIIGAALIRRALLSRVEGIQQTVSAIMQGELSHRLPRTAATTSWTRCRRPSTACSTRSSSWCTASATSPIPSPTTCVRRWPSCARGWKSCR